MFLPVIFVSLLAFHGAACEEEESDEDFALKYLKDYNYISRLSRSGYQDMTTAIKRFQKFFGLPETGRLDEETLYEMKKPRCGVPDVGYNGERMRVKRYSTWHQKWRKTSLKYYLSYGEDLSHSKQDRIFSQAFKMWSDVARKLKFSRTYSVSDADLKISFGKGSHAGVSGEGQCSFKFDGRGNVLAHAFFPEDGRLHFDEDEKFSETGSSFWGKQSLIYTAVHEIGHALGLRHSNVKGAVMWPSASYGRPKLHSDDIAGIRSLYG
ncbi:hypothetical protein ACROYT_G023103 [Oculina patagonica]